MNSEINVHKMLQLIKERPKIYDFTSKEHHNKEVVDKLWDEVSEQLNSNPTDCKSKYHILRSSYARYLRRVKNKPKGGKYKKWHLADKMLFLKNFVGHHRLVTQHNYDKMDIDISTKLEVETYVPEDNILYVPSSEIRPRRTKSKLSKSLRSRSKKAIFNTLNVQPSSSITYDDSFSTVTGHSSSALEQNLYPQPSTSSSALQQNLYSQPLASETSTTKSPSTATSSSSSMKFFESLASDLEHLSPRGQRKFKESVLAILNCLLDEQEAEQQLGTTYYQGEQQNFSYYNSHLSYSTQPSNHLQLLHAQELSYMNRPVKVEHDDDDVL